MILRESAFDKGSVNFEILLLFTIHVDNTDNYWSFAVFRTSFLYKPKFYVTSGYFWGDRVGQKIQLKR